MRETAATNGFAHATTRRAGAHEVRRRSLLTVGACVFGGLLLARPVIGQGDEQRRFRWRVPASKQAMVEETLVFEGMIEPDTESRGFVVVVVGAALLVHLARSVLRLHDELQGGTVIDARREELVIERDATLPGDIIVIVDAEGAKMHERSALPSPEALAELLVK
jgi:hypothetical protein